MSWKYGTVAALAGAAFWGGYAASSLASPSDVVLMWTALQPARPVSPADLPANWPHDTWSENSVGGVDWDATWEMMWLSELSYGERLSTQTIRECAADFGYTFRELYEDLEQSPDSEMLIAERSDRIVFAVQGTSSGLDGLTDASVRMRAFLGANVHTGFHRQAEALFPKVEEWMYILEKRGNRPVWFTGHSLGGAVSQLLAVMFVNSYLERGLTPPNVQVVTYGSPMVGDDSWVDLYENQMQLDAATVRWVNQQDFVSNLPIRDDTYRHVGRRFQIHHAVTRVCELGRYESEAAYREATGQAPICHNKPRYWLEQNAREYAWKLLDTSLEEHSLIGDYGYRWVFQELVPAAQAGHLAQECETDPGEVIDPALPKNPEGCPFATPYCCEPLAPGLCNVCEPSARECP